jgi:hypothetical protein
LGPKRRDSGAKSTRCRVPKLASGAKNGPDGPLALAYCNQHQAYLEMFYSTECVAAFEDFVVCLSNL